MKAVSSFFIKYIYFFSIYLLINNKLLTNCFDVVFQFIKQCKFKCAPKPILKCKILYFLIINMDQITSTLSQQLRKCFKMQLLDYFQNPKNPKTIIKLIMKKIMK